MNAPIENFLAFKRAAQTPDAFHQRLALFNRKRTLPAFPTANWRHELDNEVHFALRKAPLLKTSGAQSPKQSCSPARCGRVCQWFEQLAYSGPGQGDRFSNGWQRKPTLIRCDGFLRRRSPARRGLMT